METHGGPALPDELLEEAGWLRALARALCRDEHAAADLEQETWLAALRGGAHARDARAWLGSVARRLAASRGRADGRREARERRAAGERPPEAPDTADALAAVELSARLARAVARLDEPYRSTLALRYYEGLPPRRIAQRLGVDVRAVESRLRRGRERLREDLDRDCGGREVWLGVALAFAVAGGEHGGKAAVLAATALLLVGGGVTGLAVHRAQAVDRSEEQRADVELREPSRDQGPQEVPLTAEPPVLEPDTVAPVERSAVALPSAGVELVLAGSETPLVGATVVWRDAQGGHREQTDPEGRVHFASGLGAKPIRVDVAATDATRVHDARVAGDELTRIAVPRRGGRLVGCAIDFDGRAVPFAEVLAWRGGARSLDLERPERRTGADALGQFAFDDLGDEDGNRQTWMLAARAPGLATNAPLSGDVDPRMDQRHVYLVLEPAWDVFGRVMDGSGRALADVPLIAYHSGARDSERMQALRKVNPSWNIGTFDPRFELRSADDGGFALQVVGMEPGERGTWRLQANSPNHRIVWVPIEGPGRLDLRLEWGNRLEGVVLDAHRRPIEGARVGLIVRDRRTPVVTDAFGRFSFDGLSDVEGGVVHVQAKGHALGVRTIDLPRAAGTLELVLDPECRLEGLVVDDAGKPLLGHTVHFEGDRGLASAWVPRSRGWQWEDACKLPITETDDWGRFEVDGLYPGDYTVWLTNSSQTSCEAIAEVHLTPEGLAEPLVLRQERGAPGTLTIVGRVVDEHGVPVPDANLFARRCAEGEREPIEPNAGRGARSNANDGRFELSGLRPGTWLVEVLPFGFCNARVRPVTEAEPVTYGPGRVDLGDLRVVPAKP